MKLVDVQEAVRFADKNAKSGKNNEKEETADKV